MTQTDVAASPAGTNVRSVSKWRLLFAFGFVALSWALPLSAGAWGARGHRLAANLAFERLTPQARASVERLLALEPGATLASISTWADETRSPSTAAWHYVNIPRDADCHYDEARDCPGGQCVIAAIERQRRVLASAASEAEKLRALKYAVHLVPDVHQPLHAGYADDRGGNKFQLQAFGRGTNLHALWDTGIIENWPGGQPALLAGLQSSKSLKDDATGPARWAEESCRVVSAPGFYPDQRKVGGSYGAAWDLVLQDRLSAAAQRLARLLNETF